MHWSALQLDRMVIALICIFLLHTFIIPFTPVMVQKEELVVFLETNKQTTNGDKNI